LAVGEENVTTLSHFKGLCKGQICTLTSHYRRSRQHNKTFSQHAYLNSVNKKSSSSVKPWCSHSCLNPSSTKRHFNVSPFYVPCSSNMFMIERKMIYVLL
jgi:hypothetical protein